MQLKIYGSLADIAKVKWDALHQGAFPFASYSFLKALEDTGCIGKQAGWTASYLTLWVGEQLVGGMYLYEKDHSYGEYIFDWQWAQAYQRYGVAYYPKLLSAVPFTPATGAKMLVHPAADRPPVQKALLAAAIDLMKAKDCTSLHSLFIPESDIGVYREAGLMVRHSYQYHWQNRGYGTFDDFLGALKGEKRKKIVRERRAVVAADIDIALLTGDQLTVDHAVAMYGFYRSTIEKMQGIPYLTRSFFETIFAAMPEHIVLCLAQQDGRWVAGALNFRAGPALFGRYWGCAEEFSFLHFELCYYQTVEYAIAQNLQLFEAGAQGEHKLQRGFLPSLTYSAHLLRDGRFHGAIERFTAEEAECLKSEILAATTHFPFKQVPP